MVWYALLLLAFMVWYALHPPLAPLLFEPLILVQVLVTVDHFRPPLRPPSFIFNDVVETYTFPDAVDPTLHCHNTMTI